MATKNNPGKFDCYANALPDEPMFILLGRDRHAPDLVRAWADSREKAGEDPVKVAEARQCADAMDRWRVRIAAKDVRTIPVSEQKGGSGFDGDCG